MAHPKIHPGMVLLGYMIATALFLRFFSQSDKILVFALLVVVFLSIPEDYQPHTIIRYLSLASSESLNNTSSLSLSPSSPPSSTTHPYHACEKDFDTNRLTEQRLESEIVSLKHPVSEPSRLPMPVNAVILQ